MFTIKQIIFIVVTLLAALPVTTRADTMIETTVYNRGEGGYYGFRIPMIITAQNGDLLAFAEARQDSIGDDGNIDVVSAAPANIHDGART